MTNEMEQPKNEHGIEDILDVTDYVKKLASEMEVANADGKITPAEVGAAALKTSKDGVEAVVGAWNIGKQIADMTAEEKDKVLGELLAAVMAVGKVFLPGMKA